jgi:protein disulfide-isomerase A1
MFVILIKADVLESSGTPEFQDIVANNSPLLVKFYAPWCGHCKKLAPIFDEASDELEGTASLLKVDCTTDENKEVCGQYDIKGFPTLKIFSGNTKTPADYSAGRTKADIVSTMKKAARPAVTDVTDKDSLDEFVASEESVVAVFFKDSADDSEFRTFSITNKANYAFATAPSSANDDASDGDIFVYRSFDVPAKFTGDLNTELSTFLVNEGFPPLGEIGPDTYQKYMDRGLPLVWCFVDYKADNLDELVSVYETVAKDHKGALSFVKLDGVQWAKHAEHYGITTLPGIALENSATKEKFIYQASQDHTTDGVGSWVNDYVAGTLEPFLKSEEIPETNDAGVKVIVGKTFDEFVTDRKQDIFVEYYAPWCGHCKKLAPTWDELGDAFAKYGDQVVIAKVDATANDIKENISGFPTLVYYPATGTGAKYEGAREFDDLAKFVSEKTGITLETTDSDDHLHDEL